MKQRLINSSKRVKQIIQKPRLWEMEAFQRPLPRLPRLQRRSLRDVCEIGEEALWR